MRFNRMGKWYEQSECGGYTVSAAKVMEGIVYSAWKVRPGQIGEKLCDSRIAEECRQCCRDHAKARAS